MKCIVFGLGNFGLALSQRLTKRGNEVLGVDSDISKINLYKESITNTVALDVKNAQALQTLPLLDVDVVFVVFGKDFGTSLFVIALLKQFGVKRIVARSISPVHKVILTSMGITEIVNPEWEYADFFATKVELGTTIDSYVLDDDHLIIEWEVHSTFVGRKLEDANFEEEFGLKLVALKRYDAKAGKTLVMDNPPADLVFTTKDVFVLFGQPKNFRKLGIQIA
ncbi:TrkA family potassium uptake protein [uncultured Butyricimonas sp.]|uniref:potassium channel family protein n=1 Tax=uncultured Butyricimonas sp. TaxID=1268785 RepID=UPI0026DD5FD0|nr:NAD-binding protein [uncultured Butyricimonas sp.]